MLLNTWATFARNFVPKNIKKSPNLVKLQGPQFLGMAFYRKLLNWIGPFEMKR